MLEQSVRAASTATPAQLDAARPGGAENPDRSAMGLLYYFGALSRWHAMGPSVPTKHSMRWDSAAMDDLRAALAAEPITIVMDSGRKVAVHPKGEHALHRVALASLSCEWITVQRLTLHEAETTPQTLEALRKAIEAEAMLTAEFVWIVTHPGAGLPFSDDAQWEHDAPAWIREELTPFDIIAIRRAHLEVNLLRINAISERSRHLAGGGSEAIPLASFLGVMSNELQVQPEVLVRQWSLGAIFGSSLAKWEAQERAKRKADDERAAK